MPRRLLQLEAGEGIGHHKVGERAVVQVVDGRVSVEASGETVECGAGALLTFERASRTGFARSTMRACCCFSAMAGAGPLRRRRRGGDTRPGERRRRADVLLTAGAARAIRERSKEQGRLPRQHEADWLAAILTTYAQLAQPASRHETTRAGADRARLASGGGARRGPLGSSAMSKVGRDRRVTWRRRRSMAGVRFAAHRSRRFGRRGLRRCR